LRYTILACALIPLLAGCHTSIVTPDLIAKLTRAGNRKEIIELLKTQPFDPTQTTRDNDYCLHIAINHGDPIIVDLMLKSGAHVDTKTGPNNDTPLILASKEGNPEIVRLLLQHKADPTVKDSLGNYPVVFAPTVEVADMLLTPKMDLSVPNRGGKLSMDVAVKAKRLDVVKQLLDRGAAKAIQGRGLPNSNWRRPTTMCL